MKVERKLSMWIFGLLGIVVIGCAIAYIYMSRSPEENKGMDSIIGKVKKAAGGIAEASANNQKQAPVTEKYEKSDDGKVVYAFKNKDGETADGEADPASSVGTDSSAARTVGSAEGEEPKDGE